MRYCKFQNTLKDLRDCAEYWEEVDSEEEERAQKSLLKLCKQIVEDYAEED